MSSNDSSFDLDSRIAAIVERTVGKMRDELLHRMQDTESRLSDITGRLATQPSAAPAPEPAGGPLAAAPGAAGDVSSELFNAVATMDRGSSQQEVLAALLEGVGSFASRSALFLTRSDGAQGWGSYGFDETASEIQEVVLSYGEGPLATLAEGRGCVPLAASECGELCHQMGVAPATEGLLVPFVLRDRLAAALYVDRFADDPPLGRRSLQLLAYVGAQAVEGLALRQRSETPTLQVATAEAEAPGVALWEAPAAAEPVAEPEEVEVPVAEPSVPETPLSEPQVTEPQLTEPQVTEPDLTEAPVSETPVTEIEETTPPPPTEMIVEELAEEPVPEEMVTTELPAIELDAEPIRDDDWEAPTEPTPEPEAELEPPLAPAEEVTQPLDTLETEPTAPEEEPQPWAATAGADFSTVEAETEAEPVELPPPAADQPGAAVGETTEVRPPTDVSGPGWAFTASRAAAESGDDAQHEEARRLARLLVTEIKLYNEEQVEEGRRGNDIYSRLREDIDRSRQIFNERVDDAVRQETDYFHDEMVRILAGGNAEALGL